MNQKIVISVNAAWNMHNFRAGLIRAMVRHGYDVMAVAPQDDYAARLQELGCTFIHLPMDSNGTHPGRDLALLARYGNLLRRLRPMAYLGYTVKPNVYGSIAAHTLGVPVINNIAGLGSTFIHKSMLTRVVKEMYRYALRRSARVFFQNADDQNLFVRERLVRPEVADRLPGSGIDCNRYLPVPAPAPAGRPFRFLLVARMLRDKGVEEYAAAARILRQTTTGVECRMLGFVDPANPKAIPIDTIRAWEGEGLVRYLGATDDVRPVMSEADCIVLPSYREGVPRTLLEAAALARPIVATDVAGCRDIVDHQVNGLLCRAKDAHDLAARMLQMLRFSPERRAEMGMAGRLKVREQFDERIVIRKYLDMIASIAERREQAFARPVAPGQVSQPW